MEPSIGVIVEFRPGLQIGDGHRQCRRTSFGLQLEEPCLELRRGVDGRNDGMSWGSTGHNGPNNRNPRSVTMTDGEIASADVPNRARKSPTWRYTAKWGLKSRKSYNRLPAIVRERLVRIRHAVRVFLLLHGVSFALRRRDHFGRELLGHRLLVAIA